MRTLAALTLVVAALVSLAAQDRPRDDKYKDDPHAYCWNPKTSGSAGRQRERDAHGHRCECRLLCKLDENGAIVGDHEDSSCGLYCSRERCLCHQGEEACEKPSGSGLVDMDGTVVAVSRRHH